VNTFLIEKGGLKIASKTVSEIKSSNDEEEDSIGVVAENFCQFHKSISFPEIVEGGLRVANLGRTSVKYEIGIFKEGDLDCAAHGHFVHVFVNRDSMRPVPIPSKIRTALQHLQIEKDHSDSKL